MIFYHITPTSRVSTILQQGLNPPVHLSDAGWDEWLDLYLDFLASNPRLLAQTPTLTVLQVDVPRKGLSSNLHDEDAEFIEFISHKRISPENITIHQTVSTKSAHAILGEGHPIGAPFATR